MKEIDLNNITASDLSGHAELIKAYKNYLKNVFGYNDEEAAFAARGLDNPYEADFILQDFEGEYTIDGIRYEIRKCHTDCRYCEMFYLKKARPFEFYMLFEMETEDDDTAEDDRIDTTMKYIL